MIQHDRNALKLLAIVGNVVFVLWILFNWMDEANFQATASEAGWFGGFLLLLALNTALLFWSNVLRYLAIAGNTFYALYFLYDGFTNWSQLTGPEAISHVGLVILLSLSSFLLHHR